MKERLKLLVLGFLAWIVFFIGARAFFMTYHFTSTTELNFGDILLAFAHGIRMDMAMAGYFSLVPGLLFTLIFFRPAASFGKFGFPIRLS